MPKNLPMPCAAAARRSRPPGGVRRRPRRPHRGIAIMLCILASSVGLVRQALAFCRTTTCDPQSEPCVHDENDCVISGHPLYWQAGCVGFDLQETASKNISLEQATPIIEAAFATWQGAACPSGGKPSLQFIDLGPVSCDQVQYNHQDGNANIVVFRDSGWPYPDSIDSTIALTTVTFSVDTGEIYDADMEINGDESISAVTPPPSKGYDLQSIVTHEAGHFAGLAHSSDTHATMYPSYHAGTFAFRMLAPDDIAGICAAYPPDRPVDACNPTPRHGFLSECGSDSSTQSTAGLCTISAPGRARSPRSVAGLLTAALSLYLAGAARRHRGGATATDRALRAATRSSSKGRDRSPR